MPRLASAEVAAEQAVQAFPVTFGGGFVVDLAPTREGEAVMGAGVPLDSRSGARCAVFSPPDANLERGGARSATALPESAGRPGTRRTGLDCGLDCGLGLDSDGNNQWRTSTTAPWLAAR